MTLLSNEINPYLHNLKLMFVFLCLTADSIQELPKAYTPRKPWNCACRSAS